MYYGMYMMYLCHVSYLSDADSEELNMKDYYLLFMTVDCGYLFCKSGVILPDDPTPNPHSIY